MLKINRPNPADAPPWCPYFFDLVPEDNLIEALQNNQKTTIDLIHSIPFSRENFRYAENKWSIKTIFIHLIDTERFYYYRAFCSSRQVDVNIEFDQDMYAQNSNAVHRTLQDIAAEFLLVRASTISLFNHMTNEMLDFKGFPNKMVYTARSLGWMAVGHNIHHHNVLKEKYRL